MKKLTNADIETLNKDVSSYKDKVVDESYEFYKKIQAFINSNSMKGLAGESIFNYYGQVHFFLINKIMNVAAELAEETSAVTKAYLAYETAKEGIVNTEVVEEKKEEIKDLLTDFEHHDKKLGTLDREISHIAGVQQLNGKIVFDGYENTVSLMDHIIEDLESKDQRLTNKLSTLEGRVSELKSAVADIENNFKTGSGFSSKKITNMASATWFSEEKVDVFQEKFNESPFSIQNVEKSSYTTEVGAETDFGTHRAGVSANKRTYGHELDGEDFFAYANYTGFEGKTSFEGNYSESEIKARVGYAGGEVKSEDGFGSVEGEVGIAQIEGDTMLGWDDWNVHADGEAGVLTADGLLRADRGGIGVKGNAALFHAGASGGFTLWGTDVDLGVSAGKVGGGFELAWDRIEVELNAIAGGSFSIDFPW